MTLKVGMRNVISAHVVGAAKLFLRNRYLLLENLYIIPIIKRNLVSNSCLLEQIYSISFSTNEAFISKNGVHVCSAKSENNL